MGKLLNKVVFVTGSSKGIGKTCAIELLKSGAKVVINGRNETYLKQTAAELGKYGGELMEIVADVSDSKACEEALESIIARFGRLDVLILNAGLSSYGLIEDTSDEVLYNVMKVNAMGPFIAARTALPYIKKSKGSIVFISSLAGMHGIPRSSVYSMSKMALTALAQSLKTEMSGKGVHIGIIYVGFTQNDPDKMAIGPDGTIRPIQDRPGWIQQSPTKVARLILRNVKWRKFISILSPMGKVMAFFSRYFPKLWQLSMRGVLRSAEKLTRD